MNARATRLLRCGLVLTMGVVLASSIGVSGVAAATPVLDSGTVATLRSLAVEEKVAHDTYTVLGDTYDLPLFDNIASSESRHWAIVAALLAKHGIPDPTAGDVPGAFDDTTVQARYDAQLTQATASLTAALNVGAAIEKAEIRVLTTILATTVPKDVTQVATNLADGERNHLAAFESAATATAADPPAAPVQRVQAAEIRAQAAAAATGSATRS